MEFKDRGINPQDSPRIPSLYGYLTDKTHHAYSMGSDIGLTQSHQEFLPDHHHLHRLYSLPHLRHSLSSPNYPHELHEAIQIEIEKQRIREEIIISEIARRRVLEAEVRRELMMERESALLTSGDGFSFRSSPQMELASPMGLSHMGSRADDQSYLEERITSLLNGKRESGRFETHRGTPDLRASEVIKPVSQGGHEKQKIVFLGKPDENVFGLTRKAVTPPRVATGNVSSFIRNADLRVSEVKPISQGDHEKQKVNFLGKLDENISGSKRKTTIPPRVNTSNVCFETLPFIRNADLRVSEGKPDEDISGSKRKASDFPLPSGGGGRDILHKKPIEEWICAICQINSTSEQALHDHLRGKKHKSKEAAFRAAEKATGTTVDATGAVNTEDIKSVSVEEVRKNGDPNIRKYPFWCAICKVGTLCEKDMSYHEKGKKHVKRLSTQDDGITEKQKLVETEKSENHSAKISVLVNYADKPDLSARESTKGNADGKIMKDDFDNPVKTENRELVETAKSENHSAKILMFVSDDGKNISEVDNVDDRVNDELVKTENREVVDTAKSEDHMMEEDDWSVYIAELENGVADGILEP